MSTLPANSTFLPILDDLLSPDFRTVSLPGQTPQTPAETPVSAAAGKTITFVESHTGQLTTKASNYAGVKDQGSSDPMTTSVYIHNVVNGAGVGANKQGTHHNRLNYHNQQNAAVTIQQWWKLRKGRKERQSNGGRVDLKAERAKHSLRHNRTDEHVRYLETEVHRLKSALATERKLRSLQVEAIRSLWGQVQKVSTISGSPGSGDVMSQSMPNGLPVGNRRRPESAGGCMTMSLQGTLDNQSQSQSELSCSCTKEIQNLKESFTSEMSQLRKMIDQLKVDGGSNSSDDPKSSLQKRPLTLNLGGNGGHSSKDESESVPEKKKEISGYADLMASSIIEDAKEPEVNNE